MYMFGFILQQKSYPRSKCQNVLAAADPSLMTSQTLPKCCDVISGWALKVYSIVFQFGNKFQLYFYKKTFYILKVLLFIFFDLNILEITWLEILYLKYAGERNTL